MVPVVHYILLSSLWSICVSESYMYVNPVVNADCPDPGVMYDEQTELYYVTTTSGDLPNSFPIRISNNLINWTQIGYIFPASTQPSWATSNFWGPELHKINDNTYNAYFGATDLTTNLLSIGVATGSSPNGPFIDKLDKPLLNGNISSGIGYIGPHYFHDPHDNKSYLICKYNGNAKGLPTPIYLYPLSDDGLRIIGERLQLLIDDKSWECDNLNTNYCLVEGAWMIYNEITKYYYLFYSSTMYNTPTYNIGVARSRNLTSESFIKFDGSILHTKWGSPYVANVNNIFSGPGHCSVIKYYYNKSTSYEWVIIYHSWNTTQPNGGNGPRQLLIDQLLWIDDWPRIFGDTPSQTSTNLMQQYITVHT